MILDLQELIDPQGSFLSRKTESRNHTWGKRKTLRPAALQCCVSPLDLSYYYHYVLHSKFQTAIHHSYLGKLGFWINPSHPPVPRVCSCTRAQTRGIEARPRHFSMKFSGQCIEFVQVNMHLRLSNSSAVRRYSFFHF